jgi:hypothetical protein
MGSYCKNADLLTIIYTIKKIFNASFYIIAAILVLLALIRIIKGILTKPTEIKKALKNIMLSVILFCLPTGIDHILATFGDEFACYNNATKEGIITIRKKYLDEIINVIKDEITEENLQELEEAIDQVDDKETKEEYQEQYEQYKEKYEKRKKREEQNQEIDTEDYDYPKEVDNHQNEEIPEPEPEINNTPTPVENQGTHQGSNTTTNYTVTIKNCSANQKMIVGDTKKFTYSVSPTTSDGVTWSSSNTSVISVNGSGSVTALKAGSAKLKASYKNASAACDITVSNKTYTASITKTSSVTYDSLVTEKLTVSVNNLSSTNGLSYKWYLNNNLISGATSKSYSSSKYGTYKAEVYLNGSKIATATYVSSYAAPLSYTIDKSTDTKFVFVNNPEAIESADLVDNGKVIYKTSFDKNIELYFEHNRSTNTPFYYGIRIYNPNSYNVDLIINNSGISALYGSSSYYAKVWESYYSDNIVYSVKNGGSLEKKNMFSIASKSYLYLWMVQDISMPGKVKYVATTNSTSLPSDAVPINNSWSWAFDGVLNMTAKRNGSYLAASNGTLDVANVAVSKSLYTSGDRSKINTVSTLATKKKSQLTGEYSGKPIVTNNITFKIDDNTPKGTLPTYYDTSASGNTPSIINGWITNINGSSGTSYKKDILPISGIDSSGAKYTVTPTGKIITANYAVHYKENITVVNNGSKARNVAFYVNSGSGTSSEHADTTVVAFVPNGTKIRTSSYQTNGVTVKPNATFNVYSTRTNIKVWTATIPAHSQITVPSITMIGGMSYATLIKMVCVDNICRDAFAQKDFNW